MKTVTTLRHAEIDSRTSAWPRRRITVTLLAAGAISVLSVLAVQNSDPPNARRTSSPVTFETPSPRTPTAAPFENDVSLCALGADGIEAAYKGALVAQTVFRYSAICSPPNGGEAPHTPKD
ncbi:MAG TPA: hypothetical protein VM121_08500 [Acidimicrobiales bacterium]|nr:hypothetical protein [Acidimicrobiales bacterium]